MHYVKLILFKIRVISYVFTRIREINIQFCQTVDFGIPYVRVDVF